jgi:ketosteroid isomerase-like protein
MVKSSGPHKKTGSNSDIVAKMYACFNQGDLDTIRNEVFAPDIEWRLPGRHPLAGTKHGADEVLAFFGQLVKSGIHVDLTGIHDWGDDTVVEVHRGYGTAGDAKLDGINCTHYHIKNGRIQDVQVYVSNQYALDDFFNVVYAYKPIPDRLAG